MPYSVDGSEENRCLAQARLPSNSGKVLIWFRLRRVDENGHVPALLIMEIAARGEMFERGNRRAHDLVTDFEWRFPQVVVSAEALAELHACVRRSLEHPEPFAVRLGEEGCVVDIELGEEHGAAAKRGLSAVTIVCGVSASQAECSLSVDHSCLLELAEGLGCMLALLLK